MFLATTLVSSLLAILLTYSAIQKLSHRPEVVAGYTRVGVPEDKLNLLALVLLAGAGGLVAGLIWGPVGIAAAGALACYFLVAIAAHIRAGDAANLPVPVVIELLALGALVLQLAGL